MKIKVKEDKENPFSEYNSILGLHRGNGLVYFIKVTGEDCFCIPLHKVELPILNCTKHTFENYFNLFKGTIILEQ